MRLAIALILLGFTATTVFAEGWRCKSESAVGFRYDAKADEWQPQIFSGSNIWVIKRPSETDAGDLLAQRAKWIIKRHDRNDVIVYCMEDLDGKHYLECETLHRHFRIRTDSLRFKAVFTRYALETREGMADLNRMLGRPSETIEDVVMELGRCTTL